MISESAMLLSSGSMGDQGYSSDENSELVPASIVYAGNYVTINVGRAS